jgi:protein-S-isoprenylcysteine O-methyltransferase Ste14
MSSTSTIEGRQVAATRPGGMSPPDSAQSGAVAWLVVAYGAIAYLGFLGVFSYAVGFLHNAVVPKGVDGGPPAMLSFAIAMNVGLLGASAIQHTIMARPRFKRWLAAVAPGLPERSTFVLAAAALLALMYWQWQPMPEVLWNVATPWVRIALTGLSILGFGLVVVASFQIDHFHLFGIRQIGDRLAGRADPPARFSATGLYRHVRHPLMLGFLVAFWSTPTMTAGHLLFAAVVTLYVFVGTRIEERDLIRELGEPYLRYRRMVPAIFPRPWRRGAPAA